ncbi:MgtC/SapB family protein [Sinomonas atrocyanea]
MLTAHMDLWQMILCLAAALVLSTAVGLEREIRQKSAGLRTHTLVGTGAALFTIVSKYGFSDVLQPGLVGLDPSRMAAQIVSGIGFVGAGVVFVQRNKVRGLTTAASIWLAAAIGSSAGAGLLVPAAATTVAYFVVVLGYPLVLQRTALTAGLEHLVRVRYEDRTGALRRILTACTQLSLAVHGFEVRPVAGTKGTPLHRLASGEEPEEGGPPVVEVELELVGAVAPSRIVQTLAAVEGVYSVATDEAD